MFEQLDQDENAIWSLMLASGYLKAERVEYRGRLLEPWYHLRITNLETTAMFKGWFSGSSSNYNQFVRALINGDIDAMNYYMNQVAIATFSYFDVGQNEPERFYHGFVLGLIADQTDIKVRNIKREESLEDTVQTALTQIKEKCYDAELYDRGLKKEEIHHYGFAFEGKKVLIG